MKIFLRNLVLADYSLPTYDGLSALDTAQKRCPMTPFVLVSGTIGEEKATEALKKGATDLVLKEQLSRLVPAVNRALREADERVRRRRAEHALQQSEQKYRQFYEFSKHGIAFSDMGGHLLEANQSFLDMLGLTMAEFRELTYQDLTPSKWHEMDADILKNQVMTRGFSDEFEKEHVRKNGEVFPAAVRVWLIQNDQGKPAGMWAVIRDITEYRMCEEERTKRSKLESVGILTGGIAHDFNNLLTVILGNISMAKVDLRPEDPAYGFLEAAEKGLLQSNDLTNRLITFSKGGAPVKKKVSIGNLLKGAASLALSGSNVNCEFRIPDDLWPVELDEGQIKHVFNNLIMNGAEAMPEGGIIQVQTGNRIIRGRKVGLDMTLYPGKYVKISIRDTGLGIPEKNLPLIFDPYFSTKERGTQKGMGLGLATAYSIIKKHQGAITAESELGIGTTFHIHLPAILPEQRAERPAQRAERAEIDPQSTTQPAGKSSIVNRQSSIPRVLVMDDEEMLRNMMKMMLGQLGYEAEVAKDGHEAIDLFRKAKASGNPFDALILDLTIRGDMGGKEVIRSLLEIDPAVRAVISSEYFNDPVMAHFRDYGFCGAMTKPYAMKELREVLEQAIGEKHENTYC